MNLFFSWNPITFFGRKAGYSGHLILLYPCQEFAFLLAFWLYDSWISSQGPCIFLLLNQWSYRSFSFSGALQGLAPRYRDHSQEASYWICKDTFRHLKARSGRRKCWSSTLLTRVSNCTWHSQSYSRASSSLSGQYPCHYRPSFLCSDHSGEGTSSLDPEKTSGESEKMELPVPELRHRESLGLLLTQTQLSKGEKLCFEYSYSLLHGLPLCTCSHALIALR